LKSAIAASKKLIKKVVRRKEDWAIAIYGGASPTELSPLAGAKNPILTAQDVTDVKADFVADPFMIRDNGIWYLFFELWNLDRDRGEIAVASSANAIDWTYQKMIIAEPFHLSYPTVFKWENDYYLIPESAEDNSVRLYKSTNFPTEWTYIKNLLTGRDFIDPSIFYYGDRWWLFASNLDQDILRLYYADNLMGDWVEHPQSPLIQDNKKISRPGGRVIVLPDKIIRYAQDCENVYGELVRAFDITELTPTIYREREVKDEPIVRASGTGWNKIGMHTVDPHCLEDGTWIACVDGYRYQLVLNAIGSIDL
jgi:hypothetical protein